MLTKFIFICDFRFNQILVTKSFAYLRAVFKEYATLGKKSIEDTLKSEMSGDLLKIFLSIGKFILINKKKFLLINFLKF